MKDRQPTYPGRVLITPENGEAYYATLERADEPTEAGTALNKANLLQDSTCALLDIPDTSVPNDAFVKLALGIGKYGYVIHVQYPDGSPAEGFTLTGLNAPDGTAAVTNANGDAVGVSTEQSVTVGIDSPYIDINDISDMTIQSTGILTITSVTLESRESEIQTSGNYTFSPGAVAADFCAIGGGGGGTGSASTPVSSGGGGGYIQNLIGYVLQNHQISVTIGAGGAVSANGGNTTVSVNGGAILTASGGGGAPNNASPGTGNGNGGTGNSLNADATTSMRTAANGKNATGYKFNDPALGVPGGGGGGGSLYVNTNSPVSVSSRPTGGAPHGGTGGYRLRSSGSDYYGTAGTYPGGGGGTGPYTAYGGAQGCLFVRAHYEEV